MAAKRGDTLVPVLLSRRSLASVLTQRMNGTPMGKNSIDSAKRRRGANAMTEWEKLYACLVELEGECGELLRGQEGYQPGQEMLLIAKMANMYALLAVLERRDCLEAVKTGGKRESSGG